MKLKLFCVAILATLVMSRSSHAQNETSTPKFNAFKFGPTNLLANTILLGYERSITPKTSLQLFGSFTLNKPSNDNADYSLVKGFSGEVQYRIYLNPRKNLSGFFVSPFFKYEELNFDNVNIYNNNYDPYNYNGSFTGSPVSATMDAKSLYYHGGLIFGYQIIISDVFILDFYAGGGMKYTESNYPSDSRGNNFVSYGRYNQMFNTGIAPKVGFRIGTYF